MGREATLESSGAQASRGELLDAIDAYFDAASRTGARGEQVGPFTLFLSTSAWSYAARPRRRLERTIVADDVRRLVARCEEIELKLGLEWVGDLVPSLEGAAREAGLEVASHALLAMAPNGLRPAAVPGGFAVELIADDDARLVTARAVADTAFAAGGTAVGAAGPRERDDRVAQVDPELRTHLARRVANGLVITAIAFDPEQGVVATGSLQPVAGTAEIVAVATLPTHRRRGIAAAVTSLLVREAERRELALVVLAAQDEDVARVYERVGFRRVGTHLAASRPH